MSDIAPVQPLDLLLQPGFRFHPTDHELVIHYLYRKLHGLHDHHAFIPEVHVYKHEPWELPGKSFSPSTHDTGAKVEWYLFAVRCRKYPNGLRMERATLTGFWKSTGNDRPVMHNGTVVGMKKTLVFHTGRAPRGTRTNWVMHEYRLHDQGSHHIQDTYALCRVFKKKTVAPSTADANTDEDLMQSVPGGPMEYMSDGTDLDNDPKQYVPGKYMMPSVLGGVSTNNDPIQVEAESDVAHVGTERDPIQAEPASNCADADNGAMQSVLGGGVTDNDPIKVESESDGVGQDTDLMQSMLGGGGADEDPIHVEFMSNGAGADTNLTQFELGGIGTDNDLIQVESEFDGVDRGKGDKLFLTDRGANKEKEEMQAGASADDNSGNDWYTTALEEEDNSWMQFPSYDLWYTGIDMGMIP